MRLGEADQVSNGPGDDVIVAVEETVALLGGTNHACDVAGDGRFLGDDGGACRNHSRVLVLFSLITRVRVYVLTAGVSSASKNGLSIRPS